MVKATLQGAAAGTVLAPGSVVSARFEVIKLSTLLGQVIIYDAKDQKTQREIALWSLPPGLLRPDIVTATRNAVKAATAVTHKDLVAAFGASTDPAGTLYVATEPLGGTSVADLIEKKRAENHHHGLHASWQLLAHACNGLATAHNTMAHGAIAPVLLRVDAQGHVKLAGLGMVAALVAANAVGKEYLAPEVRKGQTPTARSDVYSLGAMLYELCTGRVPEPDVSASSIVSSLPPTFDIIIENCLAENPDDRFESISELKGALASLVAPAVAAPPSASEDLDVPVEFDEDIDVKAAAAAGPPKRMTLPPGARISQLPAKPPAAAPKPNTDKPAIGSRVSVLDMPPPVASPEPPRASTVDLKSMIADDVQRWMFVREGLDHGPLAMKELLLAIKNDEVQEDDIVFNTDTGERKKLHQWDAFRDMAMQARERRKAALHKDEVKRAIGEDKVSNTAKTVVAVVFIFVASLLGFVYFKTLKTNTATQRRQAELDDALASGRMHVSGSGITVLPAPPPDPTRRHGGSGSSRSGGFTSYEAAMSIPVEINMNGGGGMLSDREVSAPLSGAMGRFGNCATAEVARGGSASQVQLRIAVGGDGAPMGASVLNGSPAFRECVVGVVRSLRWRAYGGQRIGFSWGFSLE